MTDAQGGLNGEFPSELASETMARLYESQGLPEKAAAIRALCGRPHVGTRHLDGRLEVTWQVPAGAPLRMRVITFAPGERPRVVDLDVQPSGTSLVEGGRGWVCVAVGRRENGHFVPLAHARPIRI